MGLAHSPRIVTSGLIGYWDAGNIKSYPGSGTTWTDLSINKKSGTIYNTPTYNATDSGGSFTFVQASSQYVNLGYIFDNTFSGGVTMQAWIKATNYNTFNRIFTVSDAPSSSYQYWLQTNATSGVIQFGTTPGSTYTNGLSAVGIGSWVNIAATCNYGTGSIKIYLNAVDDTATSLGTPTYTADVGTAYIGRLNSAGTGYYGNFTFSNVKIYNRALTAQEVKQNFNALRGRFGI